MKRLFSFLALAAWLTGCAAGEISEGLSSTGLAGSGSSSGLDAGGGGSTSGGLGGSSGHTGTAGGDNSGGAGGTSGATGTVGGGTSGCSPAGLAPCDAGMICDQTAQVCRLPTYGEGCDPTVGCASQPPGMTCTEANFEGTSEELCLVACSATDSSACPYGTSCGDPDLLGYCSPAGPETCTPWSTCSLGGTLMGLCVPDDQGASCLAAGTVLQPFASCNPDATNSDTTNLCAAGMVCLAASAIPQTLGAAPASSGGYCVPPCDVSGPNATYAPDCAADQHCFEPPGASYGLCLPGSACSFGTSKACSAGWWCLPDSLDAASGGCVESLADAGVGGDPCQQPVGFAAVNPCSAGDACLSDSSGGGSCETLCLLGSACEGAGACTAVRNGGDDAGAALGVCE